MSINSTGTSTYVKREMELCEMGKSVKCGGFAADVRKLCSGRGKGLQQTRKNLAAGGTNLVSLLTYLLHKGKCRFAKILQIEGKSKKKIVYLPISK